MVGEQTTHTMDSDGALSLRGCTANWRTSFGREAIYVCEVYSWTAQVSPIAKWYNHCCSIGIGGSFVGRFLPSSLVLSCVNYAMCFKLML